MCPSTHTRTCMCAQTHTHVVKTGGKREEQMMEWCSIRPVRFLLSVPFWNPCPTQRFHSEGENVQDTPAFPVNILVLLLANSCWRQPSAPSAFLPPNVLMGEGSRGHNPRVGTGEGCRPGPFDWQQETLGGKLTGTVRIGEQTGCVMSARWWKNYGIPGAPWPYILWTRPPANHFISSWTTTFNLKQRKEALHCNVYSNSWAFNTGAYHITERHYYHQFHHMHSRADQEATPYTVLLLDQDIVWIPQFPLSTSIRNRTCYSIVVLCYPHKLTCNVTHVCIAFSSISSASEAMASPRPPSASRVRQHSGLIFTSLVIVQGFSRPST